MTAPPRLTHNQRERIVLSDLEAHFPHFAGQTMTWTKVPDADDPPDFLSDSFDGPVGLELVEWLDGDQMGSAKSRESQREQVCRILALNSEEEYQPTNFCGAFPSLRGNERISRSDELPLRREFFACAAEADRDWTADLDHRGNSYYQTDFTGYPTLRKYFDAIRYIGGKPHALCWIGEPGDGGAFDPNVPLETLKQALGRKLGDYSTPERQAHLKIHCLAKLNLLVHGGFNFFAYNTPSGHQSLAEIAQRAADYYAAHVLRNVFDQVWFFHSLDSADDLNQLLGSPPGFGRVKWLAELWPNFIICPGSVSG
jgi:hypothetical protein